MKQRKIGGNEATLRRLRTVCVSAKGGSGSRRRGSVCYSGTERSMNVYGAESTTTHGQNEKWILFTIFQSVWQWRISACCQYACQISKWYQYINIHSRGFESLWYPMIGPITSCRADVMTWLIVAFLWVASTIICAHKRPAVLGYGALYVISLAKLLNNQPNLLKKQPVCRLFWTLLCSGSCEVTAGLVRHIHKLQATGLDAWSSRVKYPAQFVVHWHEIYILDTYRYTKITKSIPNKRGQQTYLAHKIKH